MNNSDIYAFLNIGKSRLNRILAAFYILQAMLGPVRQQGFLF